MSEFVATSTTAVAQAIGQTIIVAEGLSIVARIAAGPFSNELCARHYDDFRKLRELAIMENCHHDPTSVGEWECKIFTLRRNSLLLKEVVELMDADNWQPAKLEHLLSVVFPSGSYYYHSYNSVVALGTSVVFRGDQWVPSLELVKPKRCLDLVYSKNYFGTLNHFLAVRKVV